MFQKYFQMSVKGIVIVSLALCLARFAQKKTDGFTLLAISSKRAHDPRWETRALTELEKNQLEEALSQPYHYFGCGGQSFVFFSDNGQYVIKFFKQRLFRPPTWLNRCPLPKILHRYREKRNWKRQDKLQRDFTSYKIAFEELQEETGVVYVHLNQTSHLLKILSIQDKIGMMHQIPLDHTDFILQKRGELVYERIHNLMQAGKIDEAKKAIFKVLNLVVSRCKKGYHDRDPNVRTNCGFIGEQAIKIDVGRLMRQETIKNPEIYRRELLRISTPFEKWVETTYPELLPAFHEIFESVQND